MAVLDDSWSSTLLTLGAKAATCLQPDVTEIDKSLPHLDSIEYALSVLMKIADGIEGTVIQDTLKVGRRCFTVPRAQERVRERASERVSAAERASEASSAEQANE